MSLYEDSKYAVPGNLEAAHRDDFASYAAPGTWWTGAERTAVAQTARDARCQVGVQERNATSDRRGAGAALPDAVRRLVGQLAVAPAEIDRSTYESARAAGLSDGQYIEVVGVVSRIVNMDVFARGIGVATRELPPPRPGDPSWAQPAEATHEGAWLPTLPSGRRGGETGRSLYGDAMQPFIYRALSLVPDEARRVMELGDEQYLPLDHFFDFNYSLHPSLSRAQVELVAGRVSALNECFY